MSNKATLTIILLIVLIVAAVGAYLVFSGPKKAVVGVHVGDTFTYKLTGTVTLQAIDATITPGFEVYNQTEYYKVAITEINGTNVTFNTDWHFRNGTSVTDTQTLDISNGLSSITNGFWAMYSSGLNVGNLIRPTGHDGITVNQTSTKTYPDGGRTRCFWSIENQFFDINDPTHNTLRYDYTAVYFDQKTGILETLNNITYYNNPLKTEAITWQLVSTSVWTV